MIDSQEGNVEIQLDQDNDDASVLFTVANIAQAVGRGFNPNKAMFLANEDFDLNIIDLEEFVGNNEKAQERVKGRIIGKDGKSRAMIEELSETSISVFGSTVSIIGPIEALPFAREAIVMLIRGSFHKTVWNYLYAYRRQLKKDRGEIWFDQSIPKEERKE